MGSLPPTSTLPWVVTPLVHSAPISKAAGCNIFLKLDNLQPSGSFKSRGIGNMMVQAIAQRTAVASAAAAAAAAAVNTPPRTPPPDLDLARHDLELPPQPTPAAATDDVHFYCSSGGNAGLACATTAATLGRRATIVVPESTPASSVARLRAVPGAEVVQMGPDWAAADAYLRRTYLDESGPESGSASGGKKRPDPVYVPPFDHPDIWRGAAALVAEVAEQVASLGVGPVDGIVCSVGGGGLLNGIMAGVLGEEAGGGGASASSKGWAEVEEKEKEEGLHVRKAVTAAMMSHTRVLAVETVGADCLNASVRAGERVTLPRITSIAGSLGASAMSGRTWELVARHARVGGQTKNDHGTEGEDEAPRLVSTTVTDAEAVMACLRFLDDTRFLVEPACGATCAVAYTGALRQHLGSGMTDEEWARKNIVLEVCGGSNCNLAMLEEWRDMFGLL